MRVGQGGCGGFRRSELLLVAAAGAGIGSICVLLCLLHNTPLPNNAEEQANGLLPAIPRFADKVNGALAEYGGLRGSSAFPEAHVASAAGHAAGLESAATVAHRAEASATAALQAVREGLASIDRRLAQAGVGDSGEKLPVPMSAAEKSAAEAAALLASQAAASNAAAQVAALGQQVASMVSLAQQTFHSSGGAAPLSVQLLPAPTPSPPSFAWGSTASSSSSSSESEVDKLKKEVQELKDSLHRLARQTDDRVATLHAELTQQDSGSDNASAPADDGSHICRTPPCSRDVESCKANNNCCTDRMFEMLTDFTNFLSRHNVTYYLAEGTLLGAIREKDIIPYTGDLDIIVPKEGWEKAKKISKEWKDGKSYYLLQDPEEHDCMRLCAVWKGMPANRQPYSKHFDWDTEKIGAEVPYYMDIYSEDMDFAKNLVPLLVYPLSNVTMRGKTFSSPRESEMWVEARYGESWRVPDHESRELADKYPTHEQARAWADGVLQLRKARSDTNLGLRMLDRAHVEHKTGNIVLGSAERIGKPPSAAAQSVEVKELHEGQDAEVISGKLEITPPGNADYEGQITRYEVFWAAEEFKGMDVAVTRIGSSILKVDRCTGEVMDDSISSTNSTTTGAVVVHEALDLEVDKDSRIRQLEDALKQTKEELEEAKAHPGKFCPKRGKRLLVFFPKNVSKPKGATHVSVVTANENGLSSEDCSGELPGPNGMVVSPEMKFSRKVQFGLLAGLSGDKADGSKCMDGSTSPLPRSGVDRVVDFMVKKTFQDMTTALRAMSTWLSPVQAALDACTDSSAVDVRAILNASRARLEHGKVDYIPGKQLDIDTVTIFMGINMAIGHLRKERTVAFGQALGQLLRPLADFVPKIEGEPDEASKACAPGFRTPNEQGCCTAAWSPQCGEICARKRCQGHPTAKWLPLDFSKHTYMCCPQAANVTTTK
eukprot:TRINITY_DN19881_c0_g1_i2.p1 TRINITY_DN19881_c0_g1~~TRINITY_DN19881_c0_g1_i2.p1  ORF type:complete len:983 (-),score=232.71 TRINITY_DN19881_c0_g1_i2:160-2988(-)